MSDENRCHYSDTSLEAPSILIDELSRFSHFEQALNILFKSIESRLSTFSLKTNSIAIDRASSSN